jgi:predicted nucleotidyltransferase
MTHLAKALHDFAEVFEEMGLSYAIMGGIAVRVYGIPRATYDIDITLALDRAGLPNLYKLVEAKGYTVPEVYLGGWIDQVAGMAVVKVRLYLEDHGVDVDIFLSESPFQAQILARRRRADVNGISMWIVSPEDLILLKLLAHRPRDFADIGDILFTQGQLDQPYMTHWAKHIVVADLLEEVLADSSEA